MQALEQSGATLSSSYSVEFEKTLHIFLFENVNNLSEIKKAASMLSMECIFVNPRLIIDAKQVVAAANKAIISHNYDKKITGSFLDEFVYNLSPIQDLPEALSLLQAPSYDDRFLCAFVCDPGDRETYPNIFLTVTALALVRGRALPVNSLRYLYAPEIVKEAFGIPDRCARRHETMLDFIVNTIMVK